MLTKVKTIASTNNMSSFPRFETNGEFSGITFVFAEMIEKIPLLRQNLSTYPALLKNAEAEN
jgi:hypothetical protein